MEDKIEVFDSKAAAKELGVTERTLQKYAQDGRIRFETLRKKGTKNQVRVYNGDDVRRVQAEREHGYVAAKPKPAAGTTKQSTALAIASFVAEKPQLETMNVFLSVLDKTEKANQAVQDTNKALLAQMETQARIAAESLNSALAQVFAAQKSQREDDLRRLELERKRKAPAAVPEPEPEPAGKPNGKSKGAHA